MALEKLEKTQWSAFCDRMSGGLMGKRAEIEIASQDLGIQVKTNWLPVIGLVYDARSDMMEIVLDGIEHVVLHPRELYVDYGPGGIESLGIVDHDYAWQIVLLRDPLMLPSPRT
jgi:hypothetical protein